MLLAMAICQAQADLDSRWQDFKNTYAKTYPTVEEELYRKGVFAQNIAEIDSINSQGLTYTAGVNFYADWTQA